MVYYAVTKTNGTHVLVVLLRCWVQTALLRRWGAGSVSKVPIFFVPSCGRRLRATSETTNGKPGPLAERRQLRLVCERENE